MEVYLQKHKFFLPVLLILTAWFAYNLSVLSSGYLKKVFYNIERATIAVAVSNVKFHAKIGTALHGVQEILKTEGYTTQKLDSLLKKKEIDKGVTRIAVEDGFGLSLIYILGMHLFGISVYSIFWIFSLLLLLSHIIFAVRFPDSRFIFSPLFLFTLTLLIFTPYSTNEGYALQVPIAGYRYFTILAALPIVHCILELFDNSRPLKGISLTCLIIQILFIMLSNFIAKSAAYSLVALTLTSFVMFIFLRRNEKIFNLLKRKIFWMFLLLISFSILFYTLCIPAFYKKHGMATDNFWHRVWVSNGLHPEWPFPYFKEKYIKCTGFPDGSRGLHPGRDDGNGECIWNDFVIKHPEYKNSQYHGKEFEKVERNEFFKLVILYPEKVLATYFYYKPKLVFNEILTAFEYTNPSHQFKDLIGIILSTIVLVFSWVFFNKSNTKSFFTLYAPLSILFISIFSMYIVAWGIFTTMFEFSFILHAIASISILVVSHFIFSIPPLARKQHEIN